MGSSRRHAFTLCVLFAGFVMVAACKQEETKPPAGDPGNSPISSGGGSSGADGGGGEGGTSSSGGSSGTSSSGGSSGTSSGDAGNCSSLPDMGNYVDQDAISGDPPNGSGGTIPDGATYNMIEANTYVGLSGTAGPTGTQLKGQLHFQNGVFERVYTTVLSGSNPSETRLRGTYTTNSTQIQMHATCPFVIDDTFQFSVDTNNNTFELINQVSKESWKYQLQ